MQKKFIISIFFTLSSIQCKNDDVETTEESFTSMQQTCMPGYPCNGVCPVQPACECPNQVKPICPSKKWKRHKNQCYLWLRRLWGYRSMEDCRDECKRKGGDLASIHTKEENKRIAKILKYLSVLYDSQNFYESFIFPLERENF